MLRVSKQIIPHDECTCDSHNYTFMIKKALLFLSFASVFETTYCGAQPTPSAEAHNSNSFSLQPSSWPVPRIPEDATNWVPGIEGVQLLIYATNATFYRGTTITLVSVIRNGATNAIYLVESTPETDFNLLLTNRMGKVYHLTPLRETRNMSRTIESAKLAPMSIPVTFGTNIEPGDYTLIATRVFSAHGGNFEVRSNPLKFELK